VHGISIPFSLSETHSLRNVRKDHPAMLAEIAEVARIAEAAGVHFAVGLSTAFGCTIEGAVPEATVLRLAEAAVAAGAKELSLSDTTGYADPAQVKRLVRGVKTAVGADLLTTLHLHNTRGLGLANALAGLEEGITTIDASLGGLGGCPYAPGASGNLVTEDLVLMLNSMGCDTGIDLDKLLAVRAILEEALPGEPLYGFTPEAGPMLDYPERIAR
jgi:hydroxymethylglutaryl-CoA lyase